MIGPMLLMALLLQSQGPQEPPRLPIPLGVPQEYIEYLNKDTGEKGHVRRFSTEPQGEIRLTATLLPGPIAEGMTPPYVLLRPPQLPPGSAETTVPRAWQGLEIYSAEHVYDGPDGRRFAVTTALPLREASIVVRLTGPEGRASEARQDMARLLEGTRAVPGWFTSQQKRFQAQADWAVAAGGILMTLYLACWAGFFRDQPLAAHGLRTGWLFAAGGAFFVPAFLGVNLYWAFPAMFVVSLAVRRIKLALEL